MAARVPPEVSRAREVRAWDLVQQGKSQAFIAQELGVTQPAVSQILDRVEKRVLATLEKQVQRQKARQTARLEYIYGEAIAAWEASKLPKKKTRSRRTNLGVTPAQLADATPGRPMANVPVREEISQEASTCDPAVAFLTTALSALSDQRKLWGLDAPKKVDVLDQRRPLEKLSDEELARRAAENAALLATEQAD